jgi:hypothetical protein
MKKLAIAAIVLSLTGCALQRFDVRADTQNAPAYDEAQTFWVDGIGQTQEIDAAKICGGATKVQRVETQKTPGNIIMTIVTLGIYSPAQARVYCTR